MAGSEQYVYLRACAVVFPRPSAANCFSLERIGTAQVRVRYVTCELAVHWQLPISTVRVPVCVRVRYPCELGLRSPQAKLNHSLTRTCAHTCGFLEAHLRAHVRAHAQLP